MSQSYLIEGSEAIGRGSTLSTVVKSASSARQRPATIVVTKRHGSIRNMRLSFRQDGPSGPSDSRDGPEGCSRRQDPKYQFVNRTTYRLTGTQRAVPLSIPNHTHYTGGFREKKGHCRPKLRRFRLSRTRRYL